MTGSTLRLSVCGFNFGRHISRLRHPTAKRLVASNRVVMAEAVVGRLPFACVPNRGVHPHFYCEVRWHGYHG